MLDLTHTHCYFTPFTQSLPHPSIPNKARRMHRANWIYSLYWVKCAMSGTYWWNVSLFCQNRWDEFVYICLYLSLPLENTWIQIGCVFFFSFFWGTDRQKRRSRAIAVFIPQSITTIALFVGIRFYPLHTSPPWTNKQTKPKIKGGYWANHHPWVVDHAFTCVCTSCFYIMFLNDHWVFPMH